MSILVTGGAGYIGSHMVVELCDAGEKVVVIDNLSTGFRQAVPDEVPLIVGDIGDQSLVDDVIGTHKVNAIIHFAGSVVVPDSVVDPLGYYNNNTIKSRSLLESAVVNAVPHFIFSLNGGGVRGTQRQSGFRRYAPQSDIAIRRVQAYDRMDAARCGEGS